MQESSDGVQTMKSWLRTIDILIMKYHLIMPLRTATPNLWHLVSAIGMRCTAEGVANLFSIDPSTSVLVHCNLLVYGSMHEIRMMIFWLRTA